MWPESFRRVVEQLSRLPGVGDKTAQRFALELVLEPALALELGAAISSMPTGVGRCHKCGNLAERVEGRPPECTICQDPRRNNKLLCVVGRIQDLLAIERSGAMRGRYFVLGRLLSPLDGVRAEHLPTAELITRVEALGVEEVILATPPSVDGEATALFLARELAERNVRVSRIASGVPHGGDLEFSDQITLGRAIEGRRTF
mgnify:CR=1 FL=1|jgi:recombination protein RecR